MSPAVLGSEYGQSALSPVSYKDAEREPDGRPRVPADNVAQEMSAQVYSAEPDKQNEARKERNRRPAREMIWGDAGEQVSQKPVCDQGTHCVAARETPTRLGDPRLGQLGPEAPKYLF